jgi:tRNA threonylcarbamoyladenosine biosynthesis protein TsaE
MKKHVQNLSELKGIAQLVLAEIAQRENRPAAQVVALSGDLGAGKTTFTKELALEIGVKEDVASPTFVIERVYPINLDGFKNFVHIDAYRMETEKDILALGWEELIENKENLIFIEWPEIVSGVIPTDALYIKFEHGDGEENRIITIENGKD